MLEPWTCHCGQRNLGSDACTACLNAAPPRSTEAVPLPEPWRPSPLFRVTAVLSAVLLLAGLVAAVFVSGEDAPPSTYDRTVASATVEVSPDSTPGPGASELERALPSLLRFTSRARGLPFLRPVRASILEDAAFRARLEAAERVDAEERESELRITQQVFRALGLIDEDVDLVEAKASLRADAVLGLYDTEKDELVVRGVELTVSVRVTLVHELVHALQDQHFDISGSELEDRDDESLFGLHGVVEGDAVRVENLYVDTLSAREQKAYEAERVQEAGAIDPDIPRAFYLYEVSPYLLGPRFTEAIVEAGGQARLDATFRDPPVSSEQLLHPEAFLEGEGIVPVAAPVADRKVIDDGIFGEFDVLILLGAAGIPGQRAAAGWGGSRYVAWEDEDETCVRVTVATDSPQDDAELRQALDRLARARKGVEVTGKGPITFTSCG